MAARDPNHPRSTAGLDDGEEEGFDLEGVKDKLGFVLRAPRRHPKLASAVFVVVAGLGLAVAATMPRTYSAQAKLLGQVNRLVPALSNPNSAIPRDDNPIRDVSDQILRRDNLVALAKEANLVERTAASRTLPLRIKDWVTTFGEPASNEDKLRGQVAVLEKKLTVSTIDNTVLIGVDWSDPKTAYDLVNLVQKNFLSARYDDQVAMISDAIAVLEEHAKAEVEEIGATLEEYRKIQGGALAAGPAPAALPAAQRGPVALSAGRARPVSAGASVVDPELAAALEEKHRQVRAVEDERARELEALRGQLSQAELTLTPQHPTVIALQQKVDALSLSDPRLSQLKSEERAIVAQIAQLAPRSVAPAPQASGAGQSAPPPAAYAQAQAVGAPSPAAAAAPSIPVIDTDPRTQLVRSKLEAAIRRYQDVMSRIDAANIELDIARTTFKYRYTVITPAEVPRGPKKPIVAIVALSSVVGGLLLALLLAAVADLASGRIVEEWQVRRRLDLEVLGEVDPWQDLPKRLE